MRTYGSTRSSLRDVISILSSAGLQNGTKNQHNRLLKVERDRKGQGGDLASGPLDHLLPHANGALQPPLQTRFKPRLSDPALDSKNASVTKPVTRAGPHLQAATVKRKRFDLSPSVPPPKPRVIDLSESNSSPETTRKKASDSEVDVDITVSSRTMKDAKDFYALVPSSTNGGASSSPSPSVPETPPVSASQSPQSTARISVRPPRTVQRRTIQRRTLPQVDLIELDDSDANPANEGATSKPVTRGHTGSELTLTYHGRDGDAIPIYKRDLACLREGQCLNDTIIWFYMA